MTLLVDIRHRLGNFELEAAFESSGRLTALFGTSGSGKTSLVNLIGGLIRPMQGRILVDGRVLVDTEKRVFVPVHRRRIGYVFQDARLFPHMTVSQNLRYGRFFTPAGERYAQLDAVVDLLGIGHLLDRRPSLLSGGEKQRVAIGRALIASPKLILMDEPLASLDDARKAEIMPYIERLRDEARIPIVYVSHSVAEVARLATDIVMLAGGRVSASGPAEDILQQLDLLPAEERHQGGSLLEMVVAEHDTDFGMSVLRSPAGEVRIFGHDVPVGSRVRVRIRASDVLVATQRPEGLSALNILSGRIGHVHYGDGLLSNVTIDCGGQSVIARITSRSARTLDLKPGQPAFAVIKTVSFDPDSTARRIKH